MAFLNHERVLGFTKCLFYTNLYDHRTFLLLCVALVDYIKRFPNVEPICIPRIKLTCPWCITFLCCILLRIFVLNFIRNAGIQFYFLYCICQFWHQGNIGLIKWIQKCLSFLFSRTDCIKFTLILL